jgi:hypothetical protein
MPKFNVGDRVERIGLLVPIYMKNGEIIRVIPNERGFAEFTEYEVNFGNKVIGAFYEIQLKLADETANPQHRG